MLMTDHFDSIKSSIIIISDKSSLKVLIIENNYFLKMQLNNVHCNTYFNIRQSTSKKVL